MRFRYAPRPKSGRHYRPGWLVRLLGRHIVALALAYVFAFVR